MILSLVLLAVFEGDIFVSIIRIFLFSGWYVLLFRCKRANSTKTRLS